MYENYGLVNGSVPRVSTTRALLRGVNVRGDGVEFPRVSRKDYRVIVAAQEGYDDTVLVQLLSRLCRPGSEAWKNFMATRGGKRREIQNAKGEYDVSRLNVVRYVPPWERRKLAAAEKDGKVKKYTLAQLFSDTYVRDKYDIPVKVMASISNLALTSPADAAATAQDCMMQRSKGSGVKIKVTAGAYASGVQAAARDIHMMAAVKPNVQIGNPAMVVGEWLYLDGQDTQYTWKVKGPLTHASSVVDIHRIAMTSGAHETMHCFGVETAKLRIEIILDSGEVVSSTVLGHVGDPGDLRYLQDCGLVEVLKPDLQDKFHKLKTNVMSLCESGSHRATALQLNDKALVVNQHVLETVTAAQVNGKVLGARQVLGGDLWAFGSNAEYCPWSFREPVVGELACIMYHNGMTPNLSPAFPVVGNDGLHLLSERVEGVVPGMSGGAVVALSDFSLLGVHCGETVSRLKATRITETVFQDMCDFVTETSVGADSEEEQADSITQMLKSRGLARRVREVVSSMVSVYSGMDHVATAVKVRGELFSPLPGARQLVYGDGTRVEAEFVKKEQSLVSAAYDDKLKSLSRERLPQVGEAVVFLGLDKRGPITTNELKVTHVGPFSRNFSTTLPDDSGFSLIGAVALALHDGAVLGVAVSRSLVGGGMFSVTLPQADVGRRSVTDVLEKTFPLMEAGIWDAEPISNVFDQSGDDRTLLGLAEIGQMHVRLQVVRELSERSVPHSRWGAIQTEVLEDKGLAKVFSDFGLEEHVRLSDGDLSVGLSPERSATTMLALLAVAFEYAGAEKVVEWLRSVKLFDAVDAGRRPASIVRRPSGFSVFAEDGRELKPYGEN